jgi:REP element-mobilizing transposase RayT
LGVKYIKIYFTPILVLHKVEGRHIMPRVARKYNNTKFLHVMVQGINKEYIFNTSEDKETYIRLLIKYSEKYDIKIVSYCVMDNHAHILIHLNVVEDLTKLMSSVNTTYGIYYNKIKKRLGYVFRDRYKVENIYSDNHMINCIRYIHQNPIKAKICINQAEYNYSSYNQYKNRNGILTNEIIQLCFGNDIDYMKIIDGEMELSDFIDDSPETGTEDIKLVFYEFLSKKNISKERLTKEEIFDLAYQLKFRCSSTKREISMLLGIDRMKLNRILKNVQEGVSL